MELVSEYLRRVEPGTRVATATGFIRLRSIRSEIVQRHTRTRLVTDQGVYLLESGDQWGHGSAADPRRVITPTEEARAAREAAREEEARRQRAGELF